MSNIFDKVNDNLYIVKEPASIINNAKSIYSTICDNTENEYEEHTSKELLNSIISRMVSVLFFKSQYTIPSTGFVQIMVSSADGDINCVVGTIKIKDKNKKTSGVLYK